MIGTRIAASAAALLVVALGATDAASAAQRARPAPAPVAAPRSCGAACLPADWDLAWTDGNEGYATPYVLELAERVNAEMFGPETSFAGRKVYVGDHGGYLARNYRNFATRVPGGWYMRHAGMDFWRPAGTPVRSLTAGVVTRVVYTPGDVMSNEVEVQEIKNGKLQNRWWNYGHIERDSWVRRGVPVAFGARLGVVMPQGKAPHVHLSVHVRESSMRPTAGLAATQSLGWGRAFSTVSGADAEAVARRYTDSPLLAYAAARDLPR
jgi:hypothetical protein